MWLIPIGRVSYPKKSLVEPQWIGNEVNPRENSGLQNMGASGVLCGDEKDLWHRTPPQTAREWDGVGHKIRGRRRLGSHIRRLSLFKLKFSPFFWHKTWNRKSPKSTLVPFSQWRGASLWVQSVILNCKNSFKFYPLLTFLKPNKIHWRRVRFADRPVHIAKRNAGVIFLSCT